MGEGGAARGGAQGLAPARRDHRDAAGPPGQAPARARGARSAADRRREVHPRRLPPAVVDQPQPRAGGQGRRAPPGPLLPHQHGHHRGAAAARAPRGTCRSSCAPSSTAIAPSTSAAPTPSSRRRTGACCRTRGRATSASSSTRSSAPCSSRAARRSRIADLPESLQHAAGEGGGTAIAPSEVPAGSLEEIERASILKALESTRWNKQAAAALLGPAPSPRSIRRCASTTSRSAARSLPSPSRRP